ncbi:hypothetical protein LWI28_000940 [Acer negundo]|uniref:Uncharacterized protein n=1 Tax=Acer negundo TaxID=4023 RepID=A0AAD5JGK3_ACENE|nr:hypothetical protein LWI28_000940 [Acer negundo]
MGDNRAEFFGSGDGAGFDGGSNGDGFDGSGGDGTRFDGSDGDCTGFSDGAATTIVLDSAAIDGLFWRSILGLHRDAKDGRY